MVDVASKPDEGDGQDDPQGAAEQADEPQHGTRNATRSRRPPTRHPDVPVGLERQLECLPQGRNAPDLQAQCRRLPAAETRIVGHDGTTEAEPGSLAQSALQAGHRPDLAQQRYLAAGQHVAGDGAIAL